jgi:hypothetical protein
VYHNVDKLAGSTYVMDNLILVQSWIVHSLFGKSYEPVHTFANSTPVFVFSMLEIAGTSNLPGEI